MPHIIVVTVNMFHEISSLYGCLVSRRGYQTNVFWFCHRKISVSDPCNSAFSLMLTANASLPFAPLPCMSFKRKVMDMSLEKRGQVLEDMEVWPCAPSQVNICDFPFPVPFPFFWPTFFFKLLFESTPSHLSFAPLFYSAFSLFSAVPSFSPPLYSC